ncbi:MAG: YgiQ family radical SAM protein [Eubacteriales bacterium]|nr:YgiQ family radical SAM protein [Eubacteriales bacterium]
MYEGYLPINRRDMEEKGWEQPDFVYVCGDAYVDHPSFGSAIISRVLEAHGYKVAMLCQPDWKNSESVTEFGEPRLGFLVSSGNMDSMVNHYTVAKKRRHEDAYSPKGSADRRPDRAVTVYCNMIRRHYKKTPIILGGIEASLRRLSHYDYWSDKVRRSVLLEAGADLISYGMGEHSIVEIADALNSGMDVRDITFIPGTVYKTRDEERIYQGVRLPDFEKVEENSDAGREAYARSFYLQYTNTDPYQARTIYESYAGKTFVVQNPPAKPLTEMEMDDVYALPYMRSWHPIYDRDGGIPALGEIKFSLTSNRGCFGECSFCALTMHEGRIVQARSHESILTEAKQMIEEPDFKGYIHDVGGPTAEFRRPACDKQLTHGACRNKRCLYPQPCKNMVVDHSDYLKLLRKLRNLPKVKKVFVRSGFRFDYLMADPDKAFLKELCRYHVSGQLRVAPEHICDSVLSRMGKPSVAVYNSFVKEFEKINKELDLKQFIVPYLMSSHPGSTLKEAVALAEYIRDMGYMPEQVQDFYPTPGTISTCMYYTRRDPLTMKPVYVADDPHEKAMQRALIQYREPSNYALVKEALLLMHREDLIGFGKNCLIPPRPMSRPAGRGGKENGSRQRTSEERNSRSSGRNGRTAVRRNAPNGSGRDQTSSENRRKENSRTVGNMKNSRKNGSGRNNTGASGGSGRGTSRSKGRRR